MIWPVVALPHLAGDRQLPRTAALTAVRPQGTLLRPGLGQSRVAAAG
jgi:hypothetical protein